LSQRRVLELDVVRGLSILMVVISHTELHPELHSFLYWPLVAVSYIGWAGVDVFFVLSGFLVGGLLMREYEKTGALAPKRFLVRRAFKVWPTYYVFLFAYVAWMISFGAEAPTPAGRAVFLGRALWPNLLHLQNYVGHSPVGWLWSLAVEEHFYLILPWVLLLVFRPKRPGDRIDVRVTGRRMTCLFVATAVACLGFRAITFALTAPEDRADSLRLYFPTHLRIDSLLCGVFLAYLVRFHDDAVQRLRPWRGAILVASVLAWTPFYVRHDLHQGALYPFGFTLIWAAAAGLVIVAHLASTRPAGSSGLLRRYLERPMRALAWLGVRSYAIYVWHGYFAQPIAHRIALALHIRSSMPGIRGWANDLLYLATYFVLGAIMYELVELPGLKLRQRLAPPMVASGAP
jgi:peptidoglycan/LPS O-acetylase OafA/YrhL